MHYFGRGPSDSKTMNQQNTYFRNFLKKTLTTSVSLCYSIVAMEEVFFLCLKLILQEKTEVAVVRVKITLACTECKQRNYNMTKEKKNHPDRMETKKYCRFCKRHTNHKETK